MEGTNTKAEVDYFADQKLPFEEEAELHRQHPSSKAGSCTLCVHRIDVGQEPVCVTGCPSKALIFTDLENPQSTIAKKLGKSEAWLSSGGTRPKVRYICNQNLLKTIEKWIRKKPKMTIF